MSTNKETEKTIRGKRVWVKITRDQNKSFHFARGHTGETAADQIHTYPRSAIGTWMDATIHARAIIKTYEQ